MNDNLVWMASDVPKFVTPVHWWQAIDRKQEKSRIGGQIFHKNASKGCQRINS
jgi:hypothetical protein